MVYFYATRICIHTKNAFVTHVSSTCDRMSLNWLYQKYSALNVSGINMVNEGTIRDPKERKNLCRFRNCAICLANVTIISWPFLHSRQSKYLWAPFYVYTQNSRNLEIKRPMSYCFYCVSMIMMMFCQWQNQTRQIHIQCESSFSIKMEEILS